MKQEDLDEPPASATAASTTSTSSSAAANGRTNKRKGKEKDKDKEKDHIFKEKHNGSGDGDPDEAPPDDIEEPDQNGEQPPAPDEDAETGDAGDNDGQKAEDEEDQGVTRCICGSAGVCFPLPSPMHPLLNESPARRRRPRSRGIHGTMRNMQSLAARSLYGLRERRPAS